MSKYHMIVEFSGGSFSPQFGDYSKRVVQQELLDSYAAEACLIVSYDEDITTIEAEIEKLNERYSVPEDDQELDLDVERSMEAIAEDWDNADHYGSTMSVWFKVCDILNFSRGITCPMDWDYRPSPLGPSDDDSDNYQSEILGMSGSIALGIVGDAMHARYKACKALGLDY